ncbi:MAG: hypothetical protein HY899_03335 [Deltaproteobacteria bacterium]|nr:hypothetical protein [Deltaproteobacteria bacterium]
MNRRPDNPAAALPRVANSRPSVEVLAGNAAQCRVALEEDFALLDRVEEGAAPAVHVWSCTEPAAVIGVGQDATVEVDLDHCRRAGIAVLRRASGGGAVMVGRGTLQYAFALPYTLSPVLHDIGASKALCNQMLIRALAEAGAGADLLADRSGDLRVGDRKAAGLALRRRRRAMLLHGTILVEAEIQVLAPALRHPSREPDYRAGRTHEEFLINLGPVDETTFAAALTALLRTLG